MGLMYYYNCKKCGKPFTRCYTINQFPPSKFVKDWEICSECSTDEIFKTKQLEEKVHQ